jgi:Zn finger protein HypA/HybF involved in hydrogenase expression
MSEDTNIYVAADPPEREWQCTECGHVLEEPSRPRACPDCNCMDADRPLGQHLYIRRQACAWFD